MSHENIEMRAFVEQELSKVRDVYSMAPERIISDYNHEKEKISEYKGRELLEMLQNADDESDSAQEKIALIKLRDGVLTIANNGNPFSRDGVISLMYSHLSPKYKRQNKIGSKGTGFRSILSWAKAIYIKSYDLSIGFSNENAIKFLKGLTSANPQIESVLTEKSPISHPIAVMLTPMWIEAADAVFNGYDTTIVIDLQDAMEGDVQNQINSLDKEVLLFLNQLEKIVIDSPRRKEVIRKTPALGGQVTIRIESFNGMTTDEKTWFVRTKKGVYQEKNYELKVAYSKTLDDHKNVLYSYFKTDVKFPFPVVVHGTFELSGNRNQLNRSETNEFLLTDLAQLLIDVAIEIAGNQGTPSWEPLKLLSFDSAFDQVVTDLGFQQTLAEKIKSNKLFPTVTGTYITHSEEPIVYKNDYGSLLPSRQFEHLTIHTEDERVRRLLSSLGTRTYEADWFFKRLSSVSDTLVMEKRAKLIAYLLQDYGKDLQAIPRENLPSLFIDDSDTVIPNDVEVVLPPEREVFRIPGYVQLRFLNGNLFQLLCSELGIKGARALADKLSVFNVQEYSFVTVLRRIVAQTMQQIDKNKGKKHKYIKALTAFLWQVLAVPDRREGIPSTIDIPLLNRFDSIASASRLYFGKDYGADITEGLLKNVNKKLFVAGPKLFGLEKQNLPEVKEFLTWLGVAEYPRAITKTFSQTEQKDYAYFVYSQLKFPRNIDNLSFTSADELSNSSYDHGTKIEVGIAEHVEHILEKASFEDVLLWLLKDPAINEIIRNKTERNADSKFALNLYGKSKTRYLYGRDIYPYLLWILRTTKWIKTKSGQRVEPTVCCFSKTIGHDLSPLIEVPDIVYSDKRFVSSRVSQEDIEYLLTAIGATSDLAKFPTETIYAMLLKLPELDGSETKARAIYKQIVENRTKEQTDRKNPAFKKYLQDGKVLALIGNQKSYHPIGGTYYVENRTFCQEVINNFPILDLDKRVGKDKVKAILGVQPLEDIIFKLKGNPQVHPLNLEFQRDFEELKPYIYALRVVKDSKHVQLASLKHSNVTLCTHIEAAYIHNEREVDFQVKPYEHFFVGRTNNVYLKVDPTSFVLLSDLREDIRFCEAIGEIVSGILKVEENRETISNLYSRNESQRRDILRTRLDDDELRYLAESSSLLGVATDPQRDFWYCVCRTASPSSRFPELETDDELKVFLSKALRLEDQYVEKVFDKLDYDDIESRDNLELIIDLFRVVGIDIGQFNRQTVRTLDLIDYYTARLDGLMSSYTRKYESYLYITLSKDTLDVKKTFVTKKLRYEAFGAYTIINSISFDLDGYFKNLLQTSFGVNFEDMNKQAVIDLTDIYNSNRVAFTNLMIKQHNATQGQIGMFLMAEANMSLLYFGEIEALENAFIKKYGERPTTSAETQKIATFRGKDISYESFEELNAIVGREIPAQDFKIFEVTPAATCEEKKREGKHPWGLSRKSAKPKATEESGFVGESVVYNLLQSKYGRNAVFWVSENARKAGVNENGSEGFHYDMRYAELSGRNVYVEVKTSTSDDFVFYISPDEVSFGEANKDDYEIYFVYGVSSPDMRILRMRQFFKYKKGESFSKNARFTVENDSFAVRFTIAKGQTTWGNEQP
ncbi:MAG: hypothetical protein A4E63_01603 [Syntrophorhabdus sp. PtaU1.Bin050]|nr:MAG: hypothetical protein A4E63_01603 [Syntrophorhabdus sp. PtaU1.Bin050]